METAARAGNGWRRQWGGPPGPFVGPGNRKLAFYEADITSAGAFGGFLRAEFHPLPFTQQLENGAPNCAAVKEMFDPALIADETEPFVDEQASNCPGRHTRILRCARQPETISGAFGPL